MSLTALILIICSAVFHATWNLMAKKNHITIPFYMIMAIMPLLCWEHVLFWTDVPLASLSFKCYAGVIGSALFDCVYGLGLVRAYAVLEMSTAYPMMRSLPLIFTAILTYILGWGAPLNFWAFLGIVTVFAGCLMIPLAHFRDFSLRAYFNRGIVYILLVAAGTTGYSLLDKQNQVFIREACENIPKVELALTYYAMRIFALMTLLLILSLVVPSHRRQLRELLQEKRWIVPLKAGLVSTLTYATVLLAMNYVTNVSYVQIFRQTGLVFGMLAGIFLLHEKATAPKITGMTLIIAGLVFSVL